MSPPGPDQRHHRHGLDEKKDKRSENFLVRNFTNCFKLFQSVQRVRLLPERGKHRGCELINEFMWDIWLTRTNFGFTRDADFGELETGQVGKFFEIYSS